jgi:Na+/H+ antiporter NhaD/arsenite permease-like protein
MLWVDGKISTAPLMTNLFIPSLVSMVVPLLFASRMVKGEITSPSKYATSVHNPTNALSDKERTTLFSIGVLALVFVPVFKYLTHLPPFAGVLIGLSFVWIYTEYLYQRKPNLEEKLKHRVTSVLKRVDSATILFFLGILLAVSALQGTGLLNAAGQILNDKIHNIYAINIIIGVLSSIVDNVPLVAVAMGMYPVVDPVTLSTVADAAFLQSFVVDGSFWIFLAYCAGVGGSILIIGSVSGVVVMGIEKISFNWYFKNISLLAFAGYIAGALSFILIDIL